MIGIAHFSLPAQPASHLSPDVTALKISGEFDCWFWHQFNLPILQKISEFRDTK